MQIKTFEVVKGHKLVGNVFLTKWPSKGYSARLEEAGRNCPSAVGIGDTEAAAMYDLAAQKYARHLAPQIKRMVLKLNAA